MKKNILSIFAVLAAWNLLGAELDLQMPFKPGQNSPVAWWDGPKCSLVEENGKKLVSIEEGTGIRFKNKFPGKAGDVLEFEITLKWEKGPVSVRLGQWSKNGYIDEVAFYISKATDKLAVYNGKIVLKDAEKPDKNGVLRKVSEYTVNIQAHKGSKNVMIENIKANLNTKEKP